MPQLILQILEKDIRETNYINSNDCAITRAIRRAGYPLGKDSGSLSLDNDICIHYYNEDYNTFVDKVMGMYAGAGMRLTEGDIKKGREPIEPADFEHIINY